MQQPEPQSQPYDVLLQDIEKGSVKIPQFQREFVWSREKSAALIDSILRGYPIGTFILWRTRESLRSVRNIGNAKLPITPDGEYANQVLDGQQRLTSLFATIRGLSVHRESGEIDDFGDIWVNLEARDEEPLVSVGGEERDPSSSMRVVDLVSQGFKFFSRYPEKHHETIERLQQRLKSYLFSVILVKDAPIDIATEIFTRINEGGKALTPFEIMVAKTYIDGEFDLAQRCSDLTLELRDVEYETVPDSVFLQVAAVLLAKDCRKKTILGFKKSAFVQMWPVAENSIRAAVDYLRLSYRIPASRLLPYPAMIVPIAYWFYQAKEKPTGSEADRLRSLFWRIAIDGTYSGATETEIAQDIRRVDQILKGEAPFYDVPFEEVSAEKVRDRGYFSTGKAFVRAILCVLAARKPESFDDASAVTIDNDWLIQANSKNYHHFFPKAHLKKAGIEDRMANHIANITIIDERLNKAKIRDKSPAKYLRQFKKNKRLKQTLQTHLIDIDGDGVQDDDYQTFFDSRCERLAAKLNELVAEGAE